MNNEVEYARGDLAKAAYADGRNSGLAVGALAASLVAFISLLGIEKAVLALVLAIFGLREARPGSRARQLSLWTLLIVGLYVVTFVVVLVLYHQKLVELVHLMQKLG